MLTALFSTLLLPATLSVASTIKQPENKMALNDNNNHAKPLVESAWAVPGAGKNKVKVKVILRGVWWNPAYNKSTEGSYEEQVKEVYLTPCVWKIDSIPDYIAILVCFGSVISKICPKNEQIDENVVTAVNICI